MGDTLLMTLEEPPQDRGETNGVVPADTCAAAVLVVAQGQMDLPEVLAVGDRDHHVEVVRLMTAPVTGAVVRIDEPPADPADARSRQCDAPHRLLVRPAGLLDRQRHLDNARPSGKA